MKKILIVFGTRPEAVKMAPIVEYIKSKSKYLSVKVCVTAQHRNLLDDVLKIFNIKPDYDLNIMTENQSLFYITTSVINKIEPVIRKENPDLVLVHGDTTTTFAAALTSFYLKIPVGHIEAGLRSYDKYNPFPEEANRLLTDTICNLYFSPTSIAKNALLKENVKAKNIFITGNSVIDALQLVVKKKSKIENKELNKILESNKNIILVTAHRRENFGKPIENICKAIKKIACKFSGYSIVYPVHPNPNIKIPVCKILGNIKNIYLLPPLNYFDFSTILKKSYLILTDSGGLQEEAPSLGKPVIVLRQVTERPEAVISGTVKVVGTDEIKIFNETSELITNKKYYEKMAKSVNPYGDGFASRRTIEFIEYYFGKRNKKPGEFTPPHDN